MARRARSAADARALLQRLAQRCGPDEEPVVEGAERGLRESSALLLEHRSPPTSRHSPRITVASASLVRPMWGCVVASKYTRRVTSMRDLELLA
jgi:hypothetical protein